MKDTESFSPTNAGSLSRKKMRLGDILLEAGVISEDELQAALALQKRTGHKLGRALMDTGAITESELHSFLSKRLNIEYIEITSLKLDQEIVQLLPEVHARRHRALVLQVDQTGLLVGMADPTDILGYDELQRILKKPIRLALVKESDLLRTIDIVYRRTDEIDKLAVALKEDLDDGGIDIDELQADEEMDDAPVIKLLQSMFKDAVQVKASDIHIEPDEYLLRIRQRVDGVLQEHQIEGRGIAAALVTRLKLMAGLDISEKRMPQDGRFTIRVNNQNIDVRVSTLPVQYGEAIVMRLLDQSANLLSLSKLGMQQELLQRFTRLIERPGGMILVTGPTGSGKTTTLYSALNHINRPETKIITIEDPVEYRLGRINQVQVNSRIGLDFGRVLRTALRQDPDIMLVGEMRDKETVDIGLRSAMTGHLVFSTLHTNSAAGTVNRLLDMGAPGYLIAAALQGIVAQRLVRRVCENCKEPLTPSASQQAWLIQQLGEKLAETAEFVRGRGCNYCYLTGYRGRIGVYELLEVDAKLTDLIRKEDLDGFLKACEEKASYVPLDQCALDYARDGVISLDEAIRIAGGVDFDVSAVRAAPHDEASA
ncbi:MAG: ATPase, T2SS/T4P/T4SS family [Woeseia sp.]